MDSTLYCTDFTSESSIGDPIVSEQAINLIDITSIAKPYSESLLKYSVEIEYLPSVIKTAPISGVTDDDLPIKFESR